MSQADDTGYKIPRGLSIAAFCRERRLPQRRVLRLVKEAVLEDAASGDASGWHVDLTDEIGVAAERPDGSARITYSVTDPGQLFSLVTHAVGVDLLTEEELARVADAARSYYELAMGEREDFYIASRANGQPFNPNEEGYFSPLDKALRRMGR